MEGRVGHGSALCDHCGAAFAPRHGGKPQRYCSKPCYSAAATKRRREQRAPNMVPCAICDKPCRRFGARAFCSVECRQERNRRTNRLRQTPEVAHANYIRHKHKWRIYNARRQARLEVADLGVCTEEKIEARFAYFGHRCWVCGSTDDLERDHVKPLSKGGLHVPANIRPICKFHNRSKKDRWPFAA